MDCVRCNRARKIVSPVHAVCRKCRADISRENPEAVRVRRLESHKRWRAKNVEHLKEAQRRRTARRRESRANERRALRQAWPERHVLEGIKQRCRDPKHKDYSSYGGRGIAVSAAFHGRDGFARFIEEIGRRPTPSHQVDRVDNDKGYEPGNIRWATPAEQGRNKRTNRLLTFGGKTLCLIDWGAETGIAHELIRARIDRLGWDVEKALTTPVRGRNAA